MILRRYIHKLLSEYYQQPHNSVVGSIQSNSIPFKSLIGEFHWRRIYGKLYAQQSGQWLTPVELFRPYYSQILANYIAEEANGASRIHVVEIGGGRGTNAKCILDHFQQKHSDIYKNLNYTIMDASPTLLEMQRRLLTNEGNCEHDRKVSLVQKDMLDVAERKTDFIDESDTLTIVIANELLDNLPHDKLSFCSKTGAFLQTNVIGDRRSGQLKETFVPLDDPILQRMVFTHPSYLPADGRPKWVPSVATQVITRIFEQRRNAGVIFADFDYLPPPDIWSTSSQKRLSRRAEGEPLVTCMNDVDHECYLSSPPLCDILFPTDFDALHSYTSATLKEILKDKEELRPLRISVRKQSDFLSKYGPKEVEKTRSRWTNFSPLLEDFSNCSILNVSRI